MDISIIPDLQDIPADEEYRIENFHCGGKGGQNVNKVETGVRVIHIPTGLVSQSTEERSQFLNKQRAMEKLKEKRMGLQQKQQEKQVNTAWQEHNRIVRGNPVRIYPIFFTDIVFCALIPYNGRYILTNTRRLLWRKNLLKKEMFLKHFEECRCAFLAMCPKEKEESQSEVI